MYIYIEKSSTYRKCKQITKRTIFIQQIFYSVFVNTNHEHIMCNSSIFLSVWMCLYMGGLVCVLQCMFTFCEVIFAINGFIGTFPFVIILSSVIHVSCFLVVLCYAWTWPTAVMRRFPSFPHLLAVWVWACVRASMSVCPCQFFFALHTSQGPSAFSLPFFFLLLLSHCHHYHHHRIATEFEHFVVFYIYRPIDWKFILFRFCVPILHSIKMCAFHCLLFKMITERARSKWTTI